MLNYFMRAPFIKHYVNKMNLAGVSDCSYIKFDLAHIKNTSCNYQLRPHFLHMSASFAWLSQGAHSISKNLTLSHAKFDKHKSKSYKSKFIKVIKFRLS